MKLLPTPSPRLHESNETQGPPSPVKKRYSIHDLLRPALTTAAALAMLCIQSVGAEAQRIRQDFAVTNGLVSTTLISGNTLYIAGNFTRVGPPTGAGVPISATTGAPRSGFPKVDGSVSAVASNGNGGWYIGGRFTSVGGVPRNNLAHVLADNTVSAWNPNVANANENSPPTVNDLVLSGNTVFVGGSFTSIGGEPRSCLAAVDATTGLATSWDPKVDSPSSFKTVIALALSGTTLYVGGSFGSIGGLPRNSLGAVDANTGQVLAWNPEAGPSCSDPNCVTRAGIQVLAISGTNVYVGGNFNTIGGQTRGSIAAVDAVTGLATPWNPDANGDVSAIAVSGGTVYVGGRFRSIGGQFFSRGFVAALDAVTGLATDWNPDANNFVNALAVRGNTVYIGGRFDYIGGQYRGRLVAVDAATGALTSWNPDVGGGSSASVNVVALDGDAVFAGGSFDIVGGERRNHLAAIDIATGGVTAWNPDADHGVSALAAMGNTIYALGGFSRIGAQPRTRLAALDARTGLALPWNPPLPTAAEEGYFPSFTAIAVSATSVYVGGYFNSIGGEPRNNIAALDPVTGNPTSWHPNVGGFPEHGASGVSVLAANDRMVFAGGFGFLDALDVATGAKVWGHEYPIENIGLVDVLTPNDRWLYVNGGFTIEGQRRSVGKFDAATGELTSWDPGNSLSARAIAVSGNVVYVGGGFIGPLSGEPRSGLAALDATTAATLDWKPNPEPSVLALAVKGPTVFAGGYFRYVNATLRSFPSGSFGIIGNGSAQANLAAIEGVNSPPDCSQARAVAQSLWPPNHTLSEVTIVGVSDPDDDPIRITVTGVTQDEPLAASGSICPAAVVRDGQVQVRRERDERGNGRVYAISFIADDGRGGSCNGTVHVCVPHDRGHGGVCTDDGQTVNSLQNCAGVAKANQAIADLIAADTYEPALVVWDRGSKAEIAFALPEDAPTRLSIFDIAGRRIAMIEDGPRTAGTHRLMWDSSALSGGVYFYRLEAGQVRITKTVSHLK